MTAPAAPHGTTHPPTSHSALIPMDANIIIVKPLSTPPPSAMST
jgi:hypothetical protein